MNSLQRWAHDSSGGKRDRRYLSVVTAKVTKIPSAAIARLRTAPASPAAEVHTAMRSAGSARVATL